MLNQGVVAQWLDEFLARLKSTFGDRLVFVGLHGSWARGEGRVESDIDITTVLDQVDPKDLCAFRKIIVSMPRIQLAVVSIQLQKNRLCLVSKAHSCSMSTRFFMVHSMTLSRSRLQLTFWRMFDLRPPPISLSLGIT